MRHYPASYLTTPSRLDVVKPLPSSAEQADADRVRRAFLLEGDPAPFMVDVIRALRLVKDRKSYVEIGTFDKGCLAYASSLLAADAVIVDVDIAVHPERTARLARVLKPRQRLATVVGDSSALTTRDEVRQALGGRKADCVFVDGNHAASYCWADYCNYAELVAEGGVMLFHDIYWRGTKDCLGVSQAAEWIDRVQPLCVVFADHPLHRFFPWFDTTLDVWGGVGILPL